MCSWSCILCFLENLMKLYPWRFLGKRKITKWINDLFHHHTKHFNISMWHQHIAIHILPFQPRQSIDHDHFLNVSVLLQAILQQLSQKWWKQECRHLWAWWSGVDGDNDAAGKQQPWKMGKTLSEVCELSMQCMSRCPQSPCVASTSSFFMDAYDFCIRMIPVATVG